jgi:hypothetical protein
MHKRSILILFVALPFLLGAQEASRLHEEAINRHFVFFNAGYRLPIGKNPIINSGHGLSIETGFNAARFFLDDAVIGLYAGWGFRDQLWSTSFRPGFAADYKASVNPEALNGIDSSIVRFSEELFGSKSGRSSLLPGCETKSFHNYSLYWGIVLQPQAAWPALKLYTGSKRSHYQGTEDLFHTQASYTIVQLRRKMYGAELMLRDPLRFLKRRSCLLGNLAISVYYEYSDLSSSSLYYSDGDRRSVLLLKHFMKSTFFDTYSNEQVFGCRISYSIQ